MSTHTEQQEGNRRGGSGREEAATSHASQQARRSPCAYTRLSGRHNRLSPLCSPCPHRALPDT